MTRNNGSQVPGLPVAAASTLARQMAAFDQLCPRLRALLNYAPTRLSPIDILPGNRVPHLVERDYWAAFPGWTPIERDSLGRN